MPAIPNIPVLTPAVLDMYAARYHHSLRSYSRNLRAASRDLIARSREQRTECRRLAAQSDRALRSPLPVAV